MPRYSELKYSNFKATLKGKREALNMIYSNIAELIGNTPLLELVNFEKNNHLKAHVVAKIESFNPAGSAKDRIAKAMLETAQREGKLDDDTVLIEPTSGNTGIALAALAAARGNRTIIVMPETMSVERRILMRAYGAEVVLTEGAKGMAGAGGMGRIQVCHLPLF